MYANLYLMAEQDIKESPENRIYEIGFHVVSSIPEEKLAGEFTAIKDILATNGAVFISEDFPKLKHLTYVMTKIIGPKHLKYDTAHFGWIKFEMNPETIDSVKKILERNDNILRFLVIKTVRESTLSVARPQMHHGDAKPTGTGEIPKNKGIKSPISEAELDKTIDALVVE